MFKKTITKTQHGFRAIIRDEYGVIATNTLPTEWAAYHWAIAEIAWQKDVERLCFKGKTLDQLIRNL